MFGVTTTAVPKPQTRTNTRTPISFVVVSWNTRDMLVRHDIAIRRDDEATPRDKHFLALTAAALTSLLARMTIIREDASLASLYLIALAAYSPFLISKMIRKGKYRESTPGMLGWRLGAEDASRFAQGRAGRCRWGQLRTSRPIAGSGPRHCHPCAG